MTKTYVYTCPKCGQTIHPGYERKIMATVHMGDMRTRFCPACGAKIVSHDPKPIGKG